MRHIDEVLRLDARGLSQHEISRSVGISRTSVRNYLERAQRAGVSWPLPEDQDAAGLEARLFKRTDEGVRSDRPEPNWLEVHHEHKRGKHVTLQLLHLCQWPVGSHRWWPGVGRRGWPIQSPRSVGLWSGITSFPGQWVVFVGADGPGVGTATHPGSRRSAAPRASNPCS